MNRPKKISGILFIMTITIAVVISIQILVNDEHIIMAQQGPGVTPIDPENVTDQTLQGYPTGDKNMSTGSTNR
ncbi:MAG TPA: hypothetical protein VFM31_01695 [Nitrososphaeraceae archaeon]|nr:hypothetical protein [Nitrososphaeraceae archaeon]